MSKHILWIASYPKSGNTLIRAIISSLFFSKEGNFDFNMLQNIPIIENVKNLNFVKNNQPNDYKNIHKLEVIAKYWLEMQTKKNLGFEADFMFVKTHHALIKFFEQTFTTEENTLGIIYVVRDPRDVAVSMCNHFNITPDESIESLINDNFCIRWTDPNDLFVNKKKPLSFLSNWEKHYLSWNDHSFKCPKLIIKYEDMVYRKAEVINTLIDFFKNNYNFNFSNLEVKIPNMIENTSFNRLQKNEMQSGFIEAAENAKNNFFNVGEKDQWLKKLSKEQVYLIEKNFNIGLKKNKYKTKYF
jgi:hypothetical protein